MDARQIREFRRSLRQFSRVTNVQLRSCCTDVTLAQCLVLLEIDDQERLTVGQLASRLRLDDSTLSRTIDGLVRRGLLERTRDDGDRRIVWARLTQEGTTAAAAIHEQNDALYRGILRRIPSAKRATVVRNFAVLVQVFLEGERESSARPACATAQEATSP